MSACCRQFSCHAACIEDKQGMWSPYFCGTLNFDYDFAVRKFRTQILTLALKDLDSDSVPKIILQVRLQDLLYDILSVYLRMT